MEKKELQKRHSSIWTISSGLHNIFSFIRRKINFTLSRNSVLNNFRPIVHSSSGFTLIEIITALGIMAILATVILTAIDPIGQFRKAQDTRRKSDLAQLQRVLEAYYQDFGRYPIHTPSGAYTYTMNDGSDDGAKQWGTGWSPYIDIIPVDPNSSKSYIYYSDADNGNQSYRIYTSLDRGGKDPDACDGGSACAGVPDVISGCPGIDETCNFGVTSPNISP